MSGRGQSAPLRSVEALIVQGLRKRGSPKLRWEDRIKQDMKELLLSEDMISDRNAWTDRIRIGGWFGLGVGGFELLFLLAFFLVALVIFDWLLMLVLPLCDGKVNGGLVVRCPQSFRIDQGSNLTGYLGMAREKSGNGHGNRDPSLFIEGLTDYIYLTKSALCTMLAAFGKNRTSAYSFATAAIFCMVQNAYGRSLTSDNIVILEMTKARLIIGLLVTNR
ncbi:hypothetical protein Tco_1275516 [Tanacetum coccineum]